MKVSYRKLIKIDFNRGDPDSLQTETIDLRNFSGSIVIYVKDHKCFLTLNGKEVSYD